ncbi:MAG: UDP-2,3-diacylglucosamine diphosphatase LpxI [Deltaproteobacteria bacterium]|nr:UDP-2,3-diacylglucosamine diphosphatase LpxI [Deltaproteobacteria bacterium]
MAEGKGTLGIIAGGGQFPGLVADSAKRQGFRVVAVAHRGETDPSLSDCVDEIVWIKLGQLGHLIKALKGAGVSRAVMAGTIRKRRLFEGVMPDLKGLGIMAKLVAFHDDEILTTLAAEFAKEGIDIVSSTTYLPDLLASAGCLTRKRPRKAETEDIRFGWMVAKELGRLDIGQCVVVRQKTVLALEAIEGTDETIRRGGRLAEEKAVVIKVSKPHQDLRFDVPSVGLETIRLMQEVKASVLALESEKTLMFDKAEMIAHADRAGIAIVGCAEDENGKVRFV